MSETIVGLVALTAMEIVLGIDNVVFISIVTGRLPAAQRPIAWRVGLGLAMVMRILLLLTLTWVLGLVEPVFTLEGLGFQSSWLIPDGLTDTEAIHEWDHYWTEINQVSWRDLILLGGGLFLVAKSVHEIHHLVEPDDDHASGPKVSSFFSVIVQILLLDIIFSLDSVITAVGMANDISIMVAAVVVAVAIMMFSAKTIGDFVMRHPTVKVLALSFLLMIGLTLIADGVGFHIPKGYIYFAMGFSIFVEMINLRIRPAHAPVKLHEPY